MFELPHSHSAFSTNALGCRLTLEVEAGKEPDVYLAFLRKVETVVLKMRCQAVGEYRIWGN